jgi:integrase
MAHVRKHPKSGKWQVRYRDPAGRERSRNFDRRREADTFAATVIADVHRGDYLDPQLGRLTFSEFAERWQATRGHLAQATRDQDRHYLGWLILPTFGSRPVASIRPSEVEGWLSRLEAAPATKAKALQKLAAVLRVAQRDGALKTNPCDGVRRPRPRPVREGRALTEAEVSAVLGAAEQVDPSMAAMVWLMARAGLRIGEVLALRRADIDLAGGKLAVRGSMSRREGVRPTKGRDGHRVIPIGPDLRDRLRVHLSAQRVASLDGALFVGARGARVAYDNWRCRTWNRIVEVAGVGDLHPHDLRHTMATRLFIIDRWTVPQVQAYLGHVDPTTTLAVYTHVSAEELPEPSRGHFADTRGV